MFQKAIDGLYEEGEAAVVGRHHSTCSAPVVGPAVEDAAAAVRRALADVQYEVPSPSLNFFLNGMDSLQAIQFGRALRSELPQVSVEARTIYAKPTVDSLAFALSRATLEEGPSIPGVKEMEEILQLYQMKVEALFEPSGLMLKSAEEAYESNCEAGVGRSNPSDRFDWSAGFASAQHPSGAGDTNGILPKPI